MLKPIMNYCKRYQVKVLADPSYGKVEKCKSCNTEANLDEGLCEACFDAKHNTRTRLTSIEYIK